MTIDPSDKVTLQQAADVLGVHYMTAYRYVRLGILAAHKLGGTWSVDPRDLDRLQASRGATASNHPHPRQPAPWAGRLQRRMVSGDTAGSWQVLEAAMASGMTPADTYVEVLGPALHAIGRAWRGGDLGIEQEHLASSVATSLIGRLGPRFQRRGRHRGNILVVMPPGDRHGLGAAMVSDILRGNGYAVLDLGPDTPPGSLTAAMAAGDDLVGVIVSVADVARLRDAGRLIAAAHRHDPEMLVIAGGFAVADAATARSLGADGWTADPRLLADLIAELTRRQS
jgi:excisionase family DNA binding protein